MNSTITDLKLQRWVDGCITRDEERELLADCDSHPGQWRRVALAFIEERAMSREFASQFGPALKAPVHVAPKSAEAFPPSLHSASWLANSRVQMFCAVAAALLLGILAGNSVQWRLSNPASAGPGNQIAASPVHPKVNQKTFPASQPSMLEYVPDPSRNERYQLPVLDERNVPPNYFDDEVQLTGLPPEIERMLRDNGIELHGRRTFQSYEVVEGEVIVVPTLRFEFRHGPANR